jgi:hypothetical protein
MILEIFVLEQSNPKSSIVTVEVMKIKEIHDPLQ